MRADQEEWSLVNYYPQYVGNMRLGAGLAHLSNFHHVGGGMNFRPKRDSPLCGAKIRFTVFFNGLIASC